VLPRENVRASISPDMARDPRASFTRTIVYRSLEPLELLRAAVGHLADRIAGGPPLAGF
jgi:hypothetical protein